MLGFFANIYTAHISRYISFAMCGLISKCCHKSHIKCVGWTTPRGWSSGFGLKLKVMSDRSQVRILLTSTL